MSRIVWTKAEKALISDELERIFASMPWKTNLDALREAQRVLPAARHIVVNHGRAWSHKERIRLARAAAGQVLKKRAEAEKTRKEAFEVAVATGIARPVQEPKEGTTARLARVFDEILDILADKVAQIKSTGATVVATGAVVVGATVAAGPVVVVTVFRPCFGTVVTVTPSAMMNWPDRVSSSPMVDTPVTSSFQRPAARNWKPASALMSAPPGRVMGTLTVYPEKFGFSGVSLTTKFWMRSGPKSSMSIWFAPTLPGVIDARTRKSSFPSRSCTIA